MDETATVIDSKLDDVAVDIVRKPIIYLLKKKKND